jgi:foldase protein PrsA
MEQKELGGRHVKIGKDRGRKFRFIELGLVVGMIVAACPARAQEDVDQRFKVPPPAPGGGAPAPQRKANTKVDLRQINVPPLQETRIPANPHDAIAIVNGQIISRQQLADECVAREGKKILEVLINRTLIEQALRRQKLEVTAAEVDEEIDTVAQRFGISRENWLRTLDKERGISPAQYAREIIYPALALRKLCGNRVQVTPKDMQDAFESQYGDKLRCRMILVDNQNKAMQIWEELHKNPGGFEKTAQERSMDPGSRSLGGLLAEPITRHAYPKHVADRAFQQLVDGDPLDKDPSHKPKNGDITGLIQVSESAWVILRREEVVPAVKTVSLKDEQVRKQTYEMIYQVKLKEAMEDLFQEVIKASAIENRLTGGIKLANEEKYPQYRVDGDVKLMGTKESDNGVGARAASATGAASSLKLPPPAALSPEASRQFRSLKPGGNPGSSN